MLRKEREAKLELWDPERASQYLDERNSSVRADLEDELRTLKEERLHLVSQKTAMEVEGNEWLYRTRPHLRGIRHQVISDIYNDHLGYLGKSIETNGSKIDTIETALDLWRAGDPETRTVFVDAGLLNTDHDPYFLPHARIKNSKSTLIIPYSDWISLTEEGSLPVSVRSDGPREWWYFEDTFYSTNETLSPEEVMVLAREQDAKKQRRIDRARTIASVGEQTETTRERRSISREVRMEVWQRDGGRCVECDSNEDLEFDHIIPHSMGGADTVRNIQLLCAKCNNEKGASI